SLERARRLPVGVVVVLTRLPGTRAELVVPRVVHEVAQGRDRHGLADDRGDGISDVGLDADVHRRVVHRVLDALTHDERAPDDIFGAGLEIAGEIEAPTGG